MGTRHAKPYTLRDLQPRFEVSQSVIITISSDQEGTNHYTINIQETFYRLQSINMKLTPSKCSFGDEEGPFFRHLITKQGIKAIPSKVKAITDLKPPKTLKEIQSLNGKVLQGAELNYPELEKLILAPVHIARRQRRIAKWAIELGEHDINFKGCNSIKGQIIADSLVETPSIEDKDMEIKKPATTSNVSNLKSTWKLYADGASSFDGSGTDLMLVSPEGKEYTYALRYQFEATNNEVEYEALLAGLRIAEEIKIKDLLIFIDSQLVANQLKGLFESRQLVIKQYLEKTKEVLRRFDTYSMEHIRRNQNKKSDALSNLAFMTFEHLTKEVLVEVLANRSINNKEVSKITIETGKNWMTPIHEYLLSGLLPEDPKEARKF
ncbi:reverse transcriptase domain-containing protein [Tanacetum coccineum]